ncbi:hypothetical protein BSKO_11465 [Bryopsis sp. KO-2023]|nr:hypothetical protein BSKO_11465 [Bryopsis sp. KO-2023]
MNMSPEPILDIVRGLSTICSFGIIAKQVKSLWQELFVSPCETCRGAGSLICRHCHGSKIRRKYPSKYRKKDNDHPLYKYECFHCGPHTMNDFKYENTPDDVGTLNVMANLKAAMSNKPRPHPFKNSAGCRPCPDCYGRAVVYRHTPDLLRIFQLDLKWTEQIAIRAGQTVAPTTRRTLEYPRGPPPALPPVEKKVANIRGLEGKNIEEVVLPYIDDSDSEEEIE